MTSKLANFTAFLVLSGACGTHAERRAISPVPSQQAREAELQPASSAPTAWDTPRPVPSSNLQLGPACSSDAECSQYASAPCARRPMCYGLDYCRTLRSDGARCDAVDTDQGVCERGLCVDPSQRPRICGQLVAFFQVALVGRDMDFAAVCKSQKCLDDMRAVVDRLPTDIGKYFAECLAGTGGFGFPELSVDFDPNAPYALPYLPPQGQPPRDTPSPSSAPAGTPSSRAVPH